MVLSEHTRNQFIIIIRKLIIIYNYYARSIHEQLARCSKKNYYEGTFEGTKVRRYKFTSKVQNYYLRTKVQNYHVRRYKLTTNKYALLFVSHIILSLWYDIIIFTFICSKVSMHVCMHVYSIWIHNDPYVWNTTGIHLICHVSKS